MTKTIEFDPDAEVLASKLEFNAGDWYRSMAGDPEGKALPTNTHYGYTLYKNEMDIMIENAHFETQAEYQSFLGDLDTLRSDGSPFKLKININSTTSHIWDGDGNTKIEVLVKKIDKMSVMGPTEHYQIRSIRLGVYGGTS